MPRRVDRTERRRHIAQAVLRLASRRGLDAVSLRDVAAEAGVSMGMVQYYFTSKKSMLLFACEYLLERTRKRIEERIAAQSEPPAGQQVLRLVFMEMLPLDLERREGTWVWMAFLARSAVEPELREFMRSTWADSHAFIAGLIDAARQRCEIAPDVDPNREAVMALSLVDGLVSHVLLDQYSPEEALRAIDDYLGRLFGSDPGLISSPRGASGPDGLGRATGHC